ncbi:MAG: aminodeoxychorismate synthase component I [Bacteroidales bacterium]|nr:aminodeoxychorismate synthase component I [Bacteroidales bacterium]
MEKSQFIKLCNSWAGEGKTFLFVIDYELNDFYISLTGDIDERYVIYAIPGYQNAVKADSERERKDFTFEMHPVNYERYREAFELVKRNIFHGNSFLLNLTFPTGITTDLTLREIFDRSTAKYRLCFMDRFVVFSPETFVRISDDAISSYPMKGTIDAALPDAERILLNNQKERWEHNTIVDLIRNDLSMVSKNVSLKKFRYIDRISTNRNQLLQVSSEIRGELEPGWKQRLGDILLKMLPAGSISGAPKKKTLEIIAEAEGAPRGYFTGIFGIFDRNRMDSAVMIRYIEKTDRGLQFRSGGGITGHSDPQLEYKEMLDKVYVPII